MKGEIDMKECSFCIKAMLYKKKWQNFIQIAWIIALMIPFFQFFGLRTSAMAGTVETSYFLVARDNLYYLIVINAIPLVAALFVGDVHFEEKAFANQIFIRGNRWKFHLSHMLVSFVSCFLLCLFFLSVCLLFTFIMLHNSGDMVDEINYIYNVSNDILLKDSVPYPELYVNSPVLRIGIYMIFTSLYAGVCGLLADTVSLFATKKIVVYLAPFMIILCMQVVNNLLGSSWFIQKIIDPYAVLNVQSIGQTISIIVILYILCCFISYCIYERIGEKL